MLLRCPICAVALVTPRTPCDPDSRYVHDGRECQCDVNRDFKKVHNPYLLNRVTHPSSQGSRLIVFDGRNGGGAPKRGVGISNLG